MSQYIHFFIRVGDKFAPIYCSSRNSPVFQAFMDGAPYERIGPITRQRIEFVRDETQEKIEDYETRIVEQRDAMVWLSTLRDRSMGELFEARDDINKTIDEYKDLIDDCRHVLNFCFFLICAIEEAADVAAWYENPDQLDPDRYIYCGIECGNQVTLENLT